jgi:hypothetical protein
MQNTRTQHKLTTDFVTYITSFSIFTIFLPKIGKFMRLGSQAQLASFGTLF